MTNKPAKNRSLTLLKFFILFDDLLNRPIVVPAGVDLKITVSPDSRNTAWVSFDGRKRQELCHGDSLSVNTSIYPIPSICAQVCSINRQLLPRGFRNSLQLYVAN